MLKNTKPLIFTIKRKHMTHPNTLRILSYDITFDPIDVYPRSKEVKDISIQIRNLLESNPQEAYNQLQNICKKYPNDPTLKGYLANAYNFIGEIIGAKQLIRENYIQFPDYFFARYQYIELCIEEDNLEEASKAFDNKFDLKLLYPHRSVFHFAEFLGFSKICAKYFYALGNTEQAQIYVDMIKKIDDTHPVLDHLTKYALYCGFKNFIKNSFKRKRKNKQVEL